MEASKNFFVFQETETLKSFLYFRKWNFKPKLKKVKKTSLKMKYYISGNGTFLLQKNLINFLKKFWPQKT